MIKHYIPKPIKRFLWFIFKSPQRSRIGFRTLLTDLRGYRAICFKTKTYHKLTVCVGVKNRSRHLLDHLVDSMNRAEYRGFLQLAVYDCGSDDTADLYAELKKRWSGSLKYVCEEQPFARSTAFNRAVGLADTDVVLICDADMSLPGDIVQKVGAYTTRRTAWFPVVWYAFEHGGGRYYGESTGMLSCYKEDFLKVGQYDERIRDWGKEDWLLYFAFYLHDIACIRTRERQFVHHYHPSLKPAGFKPLF